jgi:DNA topoisomerase-1
MNVVVVESPAKAKTINKYLGSGYRVLASYGHVRDLPSKDGSVQPDRDFAMTWEIDPRAERHIRTIAKALEGAEHLYLATDPDREGEAISWHVQELLERRKALKGLEVSRVVFNEVTKDAVLEAIRNPRPLNRELIEAYLTRRALDYLVGFTLSPVLWRKLPGARSAGRVQSVALRLVCEREAEIEAFRPTEYWTVDAAFRTRGGDSLTARLTHLDGEKLDKFALADEAAAEKAKAEVEARSFRVANVERKKTRRNPRPPFTTSTLQQEAWHKLRTGAGRTMRIAQRLYEGVAVGGETVGLVTYMRTDSVHLSNEALAASRALIGAEFGSAYLPKAPRVFKTATKNAQEAHEAIRPTDVRRRPEDVAPYLDPDGLRLYQLIWKRTVASQMESAALEQVAVDIASEDRSVGLRATGSVVLFDGFLRLYQEGRDNGPEEGERLLPPVTEQEALVREGVTAEQHATQPPPRFSEASLVKRLEELGIGRPSTYASIIDVLQDRQYVRLEKGRFIPEDRGRLVTAFLTSFFERYIQYNFTADMEDRLDDISNGRIDWKMVLRGFWENFIKAVEGTKDLTIRQVLDALDQELGPHFFPADGSGKDPRACPACADGRLGLKLGRFGAFVGCSNYPECAYTRPLAVTGEGERGAAGEADLPQELGVDPASGEAVSLRQGPYGHYVQLGHASKGHRPKRASLPKGARPEEVDLMTALAFLALPREVGRHPETGQAVTAGINRFGPYLRHGELYVSLGPDDDVLTIGLNRAVAVLREAKPRRRAPGRSLGSHPEDGKPVTLHSGRYGPYVSHHGVRASLPKDKSADDLTLEEAVALVAAKKAAKGAGSKTRKGGAAAKASKGCSSAKGRRAATGAKAGKGRGAAGAATSD